ncbi:MAG: hypothetical protein IJZ53_12215 [Tyzzerella sp.]|nr:hypothetical protein [Tyzzerella sp.]
MNTKKELLVYDNFKGVFRKLNKHNYNDDIIVGTVFFRRSALSVIQKELRVCGYILIDNNRNMYPIDIRDTEIAMLEGTYNCLPIVTKQALVEYNLHHQPEQIWSHFFFMWQFMCDWNVFDNNGSFIKMCSNIIDDSRVIDILTKKGIDVIFPTSYEELCVFAQNIQSLSGVEFFNPDYIEEANYIVDALLKGYHINMSNNDIKQYCYQLCTIVNEKREK